MARHLSLLYILADSRSLKAHPCNLQALTEAFEGADVDSFTDAIAEFDQMTKLDPWKVTLLLRAKKRIESRDEVDEEDFT